ncbi:hypothetical protein CF319_g9176 [Tilletia indica]|nr:hypothetical protein CF319_g9176 [Tilletia indica]
MPLTNLSALMDHEDDIDDHEQQDGEESDAVEFSSPYAYWFLQDHPLPRKEQAVLSNMIKAYEMRSLERHRDDEDDEEKMQNRRRAIREEHGKIYYAPYDVICSYGFTIRGAVVQHAMVQQLSNDFKALKATVEESHANETLSFDNKSVNALAAKIFFSGVVTDYSRGNGAKNLEKAGMLYLKKRPAILGPNGKKIMQPNNTTAQKQVQSAFHSKFTNLRNHVKEKASSQ